MNTIVRWNPFREMAALQSAMDRMFDETWRNARPGFIQNNLPVDVHETSEGYTLIANVPGVTADQLHVSLENNVLTISAEVPQPSTDDETRILLQERFFGKFNRRLSLPQHVNIDSAEATFENGVLNLWLPKVPEAQPRLIPIKTNGNIIRSNN